MRGATRRHYVGSLLVGFLGIILGLLLESVDAGWLEVDYFEFGQVSIIKLRFSRMRRVGNSWKVKNIREDVTLTR